MAQVEAVSEWDHHYLDYATEFSLIEIGELHVIGYLLGYIVDSLLDFKLY